MDEDVLDAFQEKARPLIDFIDGLRNIGIEKDLPIPQIAVMGDQSSGKSSVLEALSGIPFPRGTGLVTRCATQIRMGKGESWTAEACIRKSPTSVAKDECSKISKAKTPEALGALIESLTETMCGKAQFSKDVIEINLRSPDAPDLTVIDLPGIVRTATAGQEKTVVQDVNALLESYLRPVIPCNVDVATIDILERAQEVDPEGVRTVGVLTKPDLIDKGGEAEVLQVLLNNTKPLKLGYCMVKNRSQDDLNKKQNLAEARAAEKRYFEAHKEFKQAPPALLGITSLTSKLTELLVSHIRRVLPALCADLDSSLADTSASLRKLGDAPPKNVGEQRMEAAKILQRVTESLAAAVQTGRIAVGMRKEIEKFADSIQKTKPDFEGKQDSVTISFPFTHNSVKYQCEADYRASELEIVGSEEIRQSLRVGTKVWPAIFLDGSCVVRSGAISHKATVIEMKFLSDKLTKKLEIKWGTPPTVAEHFWRRKTTTDKANNNIIIQNTDRTFRTAVVQRVDDCRARPLPGFLNFDVFTGFMVEFVNRWRPDTAETMRAIQHIVQEEMGIILKAAVPDRFTVLQEAMRFGFDRAVNVAFNGDGNRNVGLRQSISKLFDRERTPSTKNHDLMDTINKMRTDRHLACMQEMFQDSEQYSGKRVQEVMAMWYRNSHTIGNASNTEQEAQDMIDFLAAYWKVALQRLIDTVHQIIDQDLVRSLPMLCNAELQQRVAVATDTEISDLFSVPSFLKRQREEMQAKFVRLRTAKEQYERLGRKHKPCDDASETKGAKATPAGLTEFGFDVDPQSL